MGDAVEKQADEKIEIEVHTLADMPLSAGTLDRAAIDSQVATAKEYPRQMTTVLREAESLATTTEEIAESCYYVVPRSGKKIDGPSARLAEIMVYAMGNMRAEADIIDIGKKFVTAMGTCFDLERNVASRVRVMRRITDKKGRRYSDDMISVTANAAMSIAYRNAVFKLIPQSFVKPIYDKARLTSAGKGKSLEAKRSGAVSFFGEHGVEPEKVYAFLGIKGLDDIGVDEIITLKGIANAIKNDETTAELVFDPPKNSDKTRELNAELEGGVGHMDDKASMEVGR